MPSLAKGRNIKWYRTPLPRNDLARLNQRSDFKGFVQTLGHLGILTTTGLFSWYAWEQLPLPYFVLGLFLHGTIAHFLLNGFHELCHKTVFKTKFLNIFFRDLFSFLSWLNPIHFWASHQEHHKHTLHPPDDLEVIFPVHLPFMGFVQSAIINPWGFYRTVRISFLYAMGRLDGEWDQALFPESNPKHRQQLFNWARFILGGHALILLIAIATGLWLLPVLISLAPFYGGWLLYLCNNAQHVGLQENVADFRLNSRTIILNPVVRFLYWHMNYHIEHHMYAGVPCYNLVELHELVKHDLPDCPVGLLTTWKEIIPILKIQKSDPDYFYVPQLPGTSSPLQSTGGD